MKRSKCKKCGKWFVTERKHICDHRPVQCVYCKEWFGSTRLLLHHQTRNEQCFRFKCDICEKRFPFSERYRTHRNSHTGELNVQCHLCLKIICNIYSLKQHLLAFHGPKESQVIGTLEKFRCGLCGEKVREVFIHSHVSKCHVKLLLSDRNLHDLIGCSLCGHDIGAIDYAFHIQMDYHAATNGRGSQKKPLRCNRCNLNFTNLQYDPWHLIVHKRKEDFNKEDLAKFCTTCGYFTSNDKHSSIIHAKGTCTSISSRCKYCSRSFESLSLCVDHQQSCAGGHQCQICDKRFTHLSLLKRHMRTHQTTKGRPPGNHQSKKPTLYECKLCNKVYGTLGNYYQHLNSPSHKLNLSGDHVKSAKQPMCRKCGKRSFATKSELEEHEKRCSGGFSCRICGFHFKFKSGLNEHMDRHRKPKKSKQEPSDLEIKIIEKVMSKPVRIFRKFQRPSECKVCLQVFKRPEHLRKHLKTPRHNRKVEEHAKASKLAPVLKKFIRVPNNSKENRRHRSKMEKASMRNNFTTVPDFNPIFSCDRCEMEMHTQKEMQMHAQNEHGVNILVEKTGLLQEKSSKNLDSANYKSIKANTYPNFMCYLCNCRFYCRTTKKRHVLNCEKTYAVVLKDMVPEKVTQDDNTEILMFATYRRPRKPRLDKDLIMNIVTLIKDDLEKIFLKDSVGNEEHLNYLAWRLDLKYEDLRKWLGIVTNLKGETVLRHVSRENKIADVLPKSEKAGSKKKSHHCYVCDADFVDSWQLNRHLGTSTHQRKQEGETVLRHVSRENKIADVLPKSDKAGSKKKSHHCSVCDVDFPDSWKLTRHLGTLTHQRKQEEASLLQGACQNKVLSEVPNSKKDVPLETNSTHCSVCVADFVDSWRLKLHLKRACHAKALEGFKRTRLTRCRKCGHGFQTVSDRDQHESICTNEQVCEICGKRFSNPGNLKAHMDIHKRSTQTPLQRNKENHASTRNEMKLTEQSDPRNSSNEEFGVQFGDNDDYGIPEPNENPESADNQFPVNDITGRSIFKCIRCGLEELSQQQMKSHSKVHGCTIPVESKDWLEILSEENMQEITSALKQDTFPYFMCHLCHRPYKCKGASKRHIMQCEDTYGIKEKTEETQDQGGNSHSTVVRFQHRLDDALEARILTKLKDDMEDFFIKDMVGNQEHLHCVAFKLKLKYINLRQWLGIVTNFKDEYLASPEMENNLLEDIQRDSNEDPENFVPVRGPDLSAKNESSKNFAQEAMIPCLVLVPQ